MLKIINGITNNVTCLFTLNREKLQWLKQTECCESSSFQGIKSNSILEANIYFLVTREIWISLLCFCCKFHDDELHMKQSAYSLLPFKVNGRSCVYRHMIFCINWAMYIGNCRPFLLLTLILSHHTLVCL